MLNSNIATRFTPVKTSPREIFREVEEVLAEGGDPLDDYFPTSHGGWENWKELEGKAFDAAARHETTWKVFVGPALNERHGLAIRPIQSLEQASFGLFLGESWGVFSGDLLVGCYYDARYHKVVGVREALAWRSAERAANRIRQRAYDVLRLKEAADAAALQAAEEKRARKRAKAVRVEARAALKN